MNGHTPGPWDWKDGLQLTVGEAGDVEGKPIAYLPAQGEHAATAFADARLLATAPELLESLERLVAQHREALAKLPAGEGAGWGVIECEAAEAIIRKAKGGQ